MENPAELGSTFGTFPSSRQGDLMLTCAKVQLTSPGSSELSFPYPSGGKDNHTTLTRQTTKTQHYYLTPKAD